MTIATFITLFLIPILYTRLARLYRLARGGEPQARRSDGRAAAAAGGIGGSGMGQIASHAQLRMSFLRWALVTVPAMLLLGTVSGRLSGSGYGDRWFAALDKPAMHAAGLGVRRRVDVALHPDRARAGDGAQRARARGARARDRAVRCCSSRSTSPGRRSFSRRIRSRLAFWMILAMLAAASARRLAVRAHPHARRRG